MREIEVKARLRDTHGFLQKAAELGIVFGEPITQDDTTYETQLPADDAAWNIFRIRKQAGKTILTMKYRASSRSRDNYELETIVEDAEQVAGMLERVGYSFGVRIRKHRRSAHYKDLELCLDEIDDLGTFVEVEKLASGEADVDVVQSELWQLLQDLGVLQDDRIHDGYDILMHKLTASKK